jgi:hypothetical protein
MGDMKKNTKKYNVVFSGKFIENLNLDEVKAWLKQNFKLNDPALKKFFAGNSFVIKRELDLAEAQRYQEKFLQGGIICQIKTQEENENESLSKLSLVSEPSSKNMIKCPKCGFEQEENIECIHCGIIFSKFKQKEEVLFEKPDKVLENTNNNPEKRSYFALGLVIFIAIIIGWGWHLWDYYDESENPLYYNYKKLQTFRMMREGFRSKTISTCRLVEKKYLPYMGCKLSSMDDFIELLENPGKESIKDIFPCLGKFYSSKTIVPVMNWYGSLTRFQQGGNEETLLWNLILSGDSAEEILIDMLDETSNPGVIALITQYLCLYDSKESMLKLVDRLINSEPEERGLSGLYLKYILGSRHLDVKKAFKLVLAFSEIKDSSIKIRAAESFDLFKGSAAQLMIGGCSLNEPDYEIRQMFIEQGKRSGEKNGKISNAFYKMILN